MKYVDKDENETLFQDALNSGDYDTMWKCVFAACQNICKSILAKRGYIAQEDELYDLAMDSTMMVMRNISERGAKPNKLSSYAYLRCLCHCNGYKQDKLSRKLKDILSNINIHEYIEEM